MTEPTASLPKRAADREATRADATPAHLWFVIFVAWIAPGAGHLLLGATRKAIVFFVILVFMFGIGLAFGGRLFPFELSDPLIVLAAAAQWALLVPRAFGAIGGWGQGAVTATTYEYGNSFLIVAGLLNVLVVFDALDRARGKRRS